jgi:thiol-disulfide isomerase/thioredoxin
MGKAERNRVRNARERIAEQQAAARRAEQRRRLLIVGGSVGFVLVVAIGLFLGKFLFKPGGKQLGSGNITAAVAHSITHVPVSTLAKVGTGALPTTGLPLKAISDKPLAAAGKPEMLYIGAEYCPFCAAMRWSMAVALSRFGTFGPFTGIHSSSTDVYPNTPTLTFYKQQYSSPYLTFTPVENQNGSRKPLQPTTKSQQALWVKYDSSPQGTGFPFIDFGNKVVLTSYLFNPQVLHGLTWAQVAGQLRNPASTVAKNVDGAANYFTASICKMTNNKPASVCTAAPIPAIESKL